jgi:hypothetical protein
MIHYKTHLIIKVELNALFINFTKSYLSSTRLKKLIQNITLEYSQNHPLLYGKGEWFFLEENKLPNSLKSVHA